jgi:hypothetical protein
MTNRALHWVLAWSGALEISNIYIENEGINRKLSSLCTGKVSQIPLTLSFEHAFRHGFAAVFGSDPCRLLEP